MILLFFNQKTELFVQLYVELLKFLKFDKKYDRRILAKQIRTRRLSFSTDIFFGLVNIESLLILNLKIRQELPIVWSFVKWYGAVSHPLNSIRRNIHNWLTSRQLRVTLITLGQNATFNRSIGGNVIVTGDPTLTYRVSQRCATAIWKPERRCRSSVRAGSVM